MQHPFESAQFIWHPNGFAINETMEFRKEITVTDPRQCRMLIHANSQYALYINDQFAANDQFPDYEHYRVYDELDISTFLVQGPNTFTITAYCQGEDSSTYRAYPAELAFVIYEGTHIIAVSDETTTVRRDIRYASAGVSKVSGQLSYSFDYDSTLIPDSYVPSLVSGPCCPMQPRPIQKLRLDPPEPADLISIGHFSDPVHIDNYAERMQNASIVSAVPPVPTSLPCPDGVILSDNWALIDLRKEQTGYLQLDLDLPHEADVLIGWGEHLEDLRVRTSVGSRCFAARFRGKSGRNTFFYPIKRLGLRYLQLHVYTEGFTLYYAGVSTSRYPLATTNLFTCADHLHSQIYRTSLRTLQGCMHEHYEDCPWREQALYTMDSRNQMLCGYYAFEEYDFAKASLKMIGLSLRSDHLLELTSPARVSITIPSFSAIYLVQLSEYLNYSGDSEFIREMLPVAIDIAEGFIARIDEKGIIRRLLGDAYWNFYEWQVGLEGHLGYEDHISQSAYDAPLSAFVSMALQSLSRICRQLQLTSEATRYETIAAQLNSNLHRIFFNPALGCYATTLAHDCLGHYAELTQALLLLCGAVPESCRSTVLNALAGTSDVTLYPITLSHSIFKYEALMTEPENYARFVFNTIADQFGSMLYQNATTFWETIVGAYDFDRAGSLCHGWSAVPVYFYLRYCVDLKQEGTLLPPTLTGIYEPSSIQFHDASRKIVEDNWN